MRSGASTSSGRGFSARIDLAVYDRLLAAVPLRPPSDRVAVVEVDERSLAELGRWPWPRDRFARLLDRLREMGAAAVGLNVIFRIQEDWHRIAIEFADEHDETPPKARSPAPSRPGGGAGPRGGGWRTGLDAV